MAWSTRQLAELAGTTVKAVRHYHEVGLLEEPARLANGYKQYGVPHLLRVVQIKRLVDLGVPLSQVPSVGRADQDPDEALRVLDADLAASIDRLERVRADLPVILRHRATVDLPAALDAVGDDLSQVDRRMLLIYARVLDDSWTDHLRPRPADERSAAPEQDDDDAFARLPADADEATRARLAEAVAATTRAQLREHVLLSDLEMRTAEHLDVASSTVLAALRELYNPAQVDVLRRASLLTRAAPDA